MFPAFATRRHRRRRARTARATLLLFLFAFTLLAPLTGSMAGAEEMGTTSNQSIEAPASTEDEAVDEPESLDVQPEVTEVPTEEPVETDETFDIVIDKWLCDDPALDAASASFDEVSASCTEAMSATFSASDAYGYADTQTGSTVAFAAPQEFVTVTETIPDGFGSPVVFCSWSGGPYEPEPVSGGSITVIGKSDDTVDCAWFNIETPDTTPSDLIVYKWECPAGYDETLPTADPILDCTAPQNGVTFTLDHPDPAETDLQSMTGDAIEGAVMFGGVEPGPYTIVETLPPGWDHGFAWECTDSQDTTLVSMTSGESVAIDIPAGEEIHCKWFNVPMQPESEHYADMTIYKYTCPAGYDRSAPGADPWADCPMTTDGIEFTLTDDDPATMDVTSTTGDTSTGMAYFPDLPIGDYTVTETVPAGTDYVFIDDCIGLIDGDVRNYPLTIVGSFDFGVVGNDGHLTCHWYNVPLGDPEPVDVLVYKFTCATGYDVTDPMSDPLADCLEMTNGITFTLTDDDPATADLMTDTGDAINGAVMFGGTEPGNYTLTETVPAGTESVFVLDCYGLMDGVQRPSPIAMAPTLDFEITGYEETITCYWFNVPEDPHGSLTVIKYACWTEEFVSEVDCEIFEDGQGFDLVWWNGSSWETVSSKTTNAAGRATWDGLDSGEYWLDEHHTEWCAIDSDWLSDDGTWLAVEAGHETVVKVFNCGFEHEWETPTKYPNTGVPPVTGDAETASFAVAMPLAALGLIGLVRARIARRPETVPAAHPAMRPEVVLPMADHLGRGL